MVRRRLSYGNKLGGKRNTSWSGLRAVKNIQTMGVKKKSAKTQIIKWPSAFSHSPRRLSKPACGRTSTFELIVISAIILACILIMSPAFRPAQNDQGADHNNDKQHPSHSRGIA